MSLACCIECRRLPVVKVKLDENTPLTLVMDRISLKNHVENPIETRVPPFAYSALREVTWTAAVPALSRVAKMFPRVELWTIIDEHNAPIEKEVRLPRSVKVLMFRDFNRPIWRICLPAGLKELVFAGCKFNQHLDRVEWPTSLTRLDLGDRFNRPIERVAFPPSPRYLSLGKWFNRPVTKVSWPESLQELTLDFSFNHPIAGSMWPPSLTKLTFGVHFDQPLERVSWPPSLQELTFGHYFNQPLDNVSWPACLKTLTLGEMFSQTVDPSSLPSSLEHLTLLRSGAQLPVLPGVTVSGVSGWVA